MDEYYVDVYHEPGIRFRPGPVLELAERYGVRGTVELLLPYTVTGPGYVRGVFDTVRTALRMLKDGRIDEGIHWLGEAVRCVPAWSRTLHRPSEPHPGTSSAARRNPAATADHGTGTRSPSSAPDAAGLPRSGNARAASAPPSQPTLFEAGHAPVGGGTPAVEVHVYPAEVARTLARSTAAATYTQPDPGAEFRNMHLIGAASGGPDDRWREVLRAGATTGAVTTIAVSDPRQVRPENRLDDLHWQRVARQVAAIVDPHAPWVAFRTRPDAIVVIGCGPRRRGGAVARWRC